MRITGGFDGIVVEGPYAEGLLLNGGLEPAQEPPRHSRDSPERRLVRAVLEQAMLEAQGPASRLRENARRWIERVDTEWPFSFNSACGWLGWDAGRVRAALKGKWLP